MRTIGGAAAALLLLAGGAVVNVAVAWGIDAYDESLDVSYGGSTVEYVQYAPYLRVLRSEMLGRTHTRLYRPSESGGVFGPPGGVGPFPRASSLPEVLPRHLSHWTEFESESLENDASGFPLRALHNGAQGLLDIRPVLPLHPIWPGFIINTLFYALLLWLLFITPFTARRMLRRRRGLCEKCAYPIGTWGGSPVCTECGAAVNPSVARSSRFPGHE